MDFSDFDTGAARTMLKDALFGAEDGELYLETELSEHFVRDDGVLRSASFDVQQGLGLRAVVDAFTAYAHASTLSLESLRRASETVKGAMKGYSGTYTLPPFSGTRPALYAAASPLDSFDMPTKIKLLSEIESYIRTHDNRVRNVNISLSGKIQTIRIIRPDGFVANDIRPLVRMDVSVTLEQNGRIETGHDGQGGRRDYAAFFAPETWQRAADEALRQARVALEAIDAPAGTMDVVMGAGWPGVMLHEAIGHGLEGDFHRKETSVFTGMLGQMIAHPDVTVVDDGTLDGRRGSLSIDDEGTPTARTTLIENGRLVGLMYDRLNARLCSTQSTGNGRRESYAHKPMPRMTNTMMLSGKHTPEEIIASVKRGIYAPHFGGGQVDITSGQFVFSASEAYLIEDGEITAPIKGATLIGKGADALTRIKMVGNDSCLDNGVGTCGKDGQSVPVGVGQPTLLMQGITVGGTSL